MILDSINELVLICILSAVNELLVNMSYFGI